MIKILHTYKFFTKFVLGAITLMIAGAFIFWGIGPKDNKSSSFVAQIEDEKITLEQFWRMHENEVNRLREEKKSPEEIEKLNLKDRVLANMVNRAVLIVAARKAGITVNDKEVQEAIINTTYFQKDGVFDQQIYKRALTLNRLTPQIFETSVRNDLVIFKMSNLIGETAELSSDELKIIDSINAESKGQLRSMFLSSKNYQAIQAYIEGMKRHMDIKINSDLIS